MRSCAGSIKTAAALRNITDLRPVIDVPTRWSSKFNMCTRFMRLHGPLVDIIVQEENGDLDSNLKVTVTQANVLYRKSRDSLKWLRHLDGVVRALQTTGLTLAKGADILNSLEQRIRRHKLVGLNKDMYHCPLVMKRSSVHSTVHSTDKSFETGVIKIQNGEWMSLTDAERESCQGLIKVEDDDESVQDSTHESHGSEVGSEDDDMYHGDRDLPGSPDLLAELKQVEENRATANAERNPYDNLDCIICSTAMVKRLWNTGRNILRYNRRGMSPLMFETLMYLKFNERIWNNDKFMMEAIVRASKSRKDEKLQQELQEDRDQEDLFDSLIADEQLLEEEGD
jgi:hypothetical protein